MSTSIYTSLFCKSVSGDPYLIQISYDCVILCALSEVHRNINRTEFASYHCIFRTSYTSQKWMMRGPSSTIIHWFWKYISKKYLSVVYFCNEHENKNDRVFVFAKFFNNTDLYSSKIYVQCIYTPNTSTCQFARLSLREKPVSRSDNTILVLFWRKHWFLCSKIFIISMPMHFICHYSSFYNGDRTKNTYQQLFISIPISYDSFRFKLKILINIPVLRCFQKLYFVQQRIII